MGEVISVYFNDKKVAEIQASSDTLTWDFEPDWSQETNKLYVTGTQHEKPSNVVYFFPQNFAVFLWLFSEQFVYIIQELAQSKQDFFIQNNVIGDSIRPEFKTSKDYYELSKYVFDEIIPPLRDFTDSLLKRAYYLQTAYNWKTTFFISLILFYEIFYPYLKDKTGGKYFPYFLPYDEVEVFTLRQLVERIQGNTIYFKQDTFYRLGTNYFIGTNPESFTIFNPGERVVYIDFYQNLRHKGAKAFINRKEISDFLSLVDLTYIGLTQDVYIDSDGRYTGSKGSYFVILDPPLFSYQYQFSLPYLQDTGLRIIDRVIVEVPYVPSVPIALGINRLTYQRFIPVYYFYYDGSRITTLWEPSFLTTEYSDLRLFSNSYYADGEIYVSLRDDLFIPEVKSSLNDFGKQVVKAMGFYWDLCKLSINKLYLLIGIFEDRIYKQRAKPVFWKNFDYWLTSLE
jgi:hypothetical protein